MQIRKVQKAKSKLRLGLAGTSGSGKTYSALLLAKGLVGKWDKICVIDTENQSADLYEHLGSYNVITLEAPFSPERYVEAIDSAEKGGMEVIIIDSITHEWDGKGGALQIQEQLGGRYQDWAKVTPRHQAFITKILESKSHIITTVRKKQDYAMINENGKTKVEKRGLKEITREGFEYELTLAFDLQQNHLASTSKDRTGLFMDKPEFVITEETGKQIKAWANKGVDMEKELAKQKAKEEAEAKIAEQKAIEHKATMVKKLDDLLTKKGKSEGAMLEKYKAKEISELPIGIIKSAVEALEKLPDRIEPEVEVNPDEVDAGIEAMNKEKEAKKASPQPEPEDIPLPDAEQS